MSLPSQSFSVTFSNPSSSSSEKLLTLDQESWEVHTGKMTMANIVRYVRSLMFPDENNQESYVDCGLDSEGRVATVIHVYPLRMNVGYHLYTSYGDLTSRPVISEDPQQEIIKFENASTASLRLPCFGISEWEWLGLIYDVNNNSIPSPSVSFEGKTITLSESIGGSPQPVYGTVQLTYRTFKKSHGLIVTPRTDVIEGAFSAAVWAVFDGGIEYTELSEPPGAESVHGGFTCGGGSSTNVETPDDLPQHPNGEINKYTDIEYCTQILIEERTS